MNSSSRRRTKTITMTRKSLTAPFTTLASSSLYGVVKDRSLADSAGKWTRGETTPEGRRLGMKGGRKGLGRKGDKEEGRMVFGR